MSLHPTDSEEELTKATSSHSYLGRNVKLMVFYSMSILLSCSIQHHPLKIRLKN